MQEKLAVSRVAGNRRLRHVFANQSYLTGRPGDFIDHALMDGGIAHDSFLADLPAACLELGFDQRDDVGEIAEQLWLAGKNV